MIKERKQTAAEQKGCLLRGKTEPQPWQKQGCSKLFQLMKCQIKTNNTEINNYFHHIPICSSFPWLNYRSFNLYVSGVIPSVRPIAQRQMSCIKDIVVVIFKQKKKSTNQTIVFSANGNSHNKALCLQRKVCRILQGASSLLHCSIQFNFIYVAPNHKNRLSQGALHSKVKTQQ